MRGAMIPFSLLKASQAFKAAQPGEVLEIYGDPDTTLDLFKVLPKSAYALLFMEETQDGVTCRPTLSKKKSPEELHEAAGGIMKMKRRLPGQLRKAEKPPHRFIPWLGGIAGSGEDAPVTATPPRSASTDRGSR